ncbi:putative RNA 2'-phosphotransferase [Herbihabitans rhizosphaerae]|uniref:Probable RNA 2'-phosphotransferase n=1 Tax=Herbihabitans rhizosphaerae TaxID=1872711 RepID=A0A4Q7KHW1_9PSEU|nr:RNA 2'-phosphotransferase [Herbihabitans rhizosphaerae]RZS34892.1 putative RNA 2'-phosphotransferase [Herbihabitans rhizosphaerae]
MNDERIKRVSKRLSLHLRHAPDKIGIELDPAGWVSVEELLKALQDNGFPVTRAELDIVVTTNDKQRFALDETGTRIRANQGHSVSVDLGLPTVDPPDVLYHGTVEHALPAIEREGLRPMKRHHVHLSATVDTARTVGARRGRPIVLAVDAAAMAADGAVFRLSENGVWLADTVPPRHLKRM